VSRCLHTADQVGKKQGITSECQAQEGWVRDCNILQPKEYRPEVGGCQGGTEMQTCAAEYGST